jgi:thiol-disulfide isomerase/thioredoxin
MELLRGGSMNITARSRTVLVLLLALGWLAAGQLLAQDRQAPPEYKELVAAYDLRDAAARLKEFERIKAAYPNSQYMEAIEASVLEAKVELAETLEAVLSLQKDFMAKGRGPSRLQNPIVMAVQLLRHPRLEAFDKNTVLTATLMYKDEALKASNDPATYEGIPQEQRDLFKSQFLNVVVLLAAKAYLNAGDTAKATAGLENYKQAGGATGGNYYHTLAAVKEKMGRIDEAYDAYLTAAVENFEDAADRAKALYVKIHGGADGFEAALAAKFKALPFYPQPFSSPAAWRGKAVLAELFTGSECPPCVGADLAFDGLVETIPAKYLAVLVYHLPIPRPDPMMNPATQSRQSVYGVDSTPTVVIDGTNKSLGGGGRGAAEGKFTQYRAAIEPLLAAVPAVTLKVRASFAGDTVKAAYEFDKVVPGADYLLVLVQDEQEHKGSNGVVYHKMVVRDLLAIDPAAPMSVAFDLAASEKAADAYLTEFENAYTRVPNFKWDVRRNVLPRKGLKVVFFVQERESKKVLNAVVAEVK